MFKRSNLVGKAYNVEAAINTALTQPVETNEKKSPASKKAEKLTSIATNLTLAGVMMISYAANNVAFAAGDIPNPSDNVFKMLASIIGAMGIAVIMGGIISLIMGAIHLVDAKKDEDGDPQGEKKATKKITCGVFAIAVGIILKIVVWVAHF